MQITMNSTQSVFIVAIYWLQFIYYLHIAQPSGKIKSEEINKEVSYRMTGIYLTLFCVIMYIFSFWSNTNVMNYALVFVLIFAKSLTDLVMIAIKMANQSP
jgi:hypothetical protein